MKKSLWRIQRDWNVKKFELRSTELEKSDESQNRNNWTILEQTSEIVKKTAESEKLGNLRNKVRREVE